MNTSTTVMMMVMIPILAFAQAADFREERRVLDRRAGALNDEAQRLGTVGTASDETIRNAEKLAGVLDEFDRRGPDLDRKIVEATKQVNEVEKLMGWKDASGLNWAVAQFDKYVVSTWFRGSYGPHERRYWAAYDHLQGLKEERAELEQVKERELAGNPRGLPRSTAALRRAAEVASLDADLARRQKRRAQERLQALRAELDRIELDRRALEARRRTAESPAPPWTPDPEPSSPPEPRRISLTVVDVSGYGRPEGYEPIEQCTWKFFVNVVDDSDQVWDLRRMQIETVQYTPAKIQRGTRSAPSIGMLQWTGRGPLRAGPFYLTVQKPDGYQGSFRGAFAIDGVRYEITWQSPGRPPVGPPSVPPSPSPGPPGPRELAVSGGLDEQVRKHKVHHILEELGFREASYSANTVTLTIVPPDAPGLPWQGRISPGQITHERHLLHPKGRGPDFEEWWKVKISLRDGKGHDGAQTGAASVVHEYRSSFGAKARREYPDERWHAVRQADGSYRMHVPGIEDGIPYRLEGARGQAR